MSESESPFTYGSAYEAEDALTRHYGLGADLYKTWGSPVSVLSAVLRGWAKSDHPAQLHYAWDLENARSLDAGIRGMTETVLSLLDLANQEGVEVFDAGCGLGGATTQAARSFPRQRWVGMSLVESQIQTARERATSQRLANVEFVHGNYLDTNFEESRFAGAFAIETICHIPDSEKPRAFAELRRILKPGAKLVVMDGVRLRDARDEGELRTMTDILEGWTLPLASMEADMARYALEAGFEIVIREDVSSHVLASSTRIYNINRYLLRPLSRLARLPALRSVAARLGFVSQVTAERFIDACVAQREVLTNGLAAYYCYVFRRPED